jgi:hypothetical protein
MLSSLGEQTSKHEPKLPLFRILFYPDLNPLGPIAEDVKIKAPLKYVTALLTAVH